MHGLICFFLCMLLSHVTISVDTVFILNESNIEEFKNSAGIRLVYFNKEVKADAEEQRLFLVQYEKSAKIIDTYGVQFGQVDCAVNDAISFCADEDAGKKVFVFRNGHKLLTLAINNLFDVDSIVSNVLQVVLLRTVPILQQLEDRTDFVHKFREHYDFFFSYYSAIGTHEYRVFMEVAFAYQSRYKFGLTTEQKVVSDLRDYDEEEDFALWHFQCVGLALDSPCIVRKYKDVMELTTLARYVNALDFPPVMSLEDTENGENPFPGLDIHTVFIYYSKELEEIAFEETAVLAEYFAGLAGILLIDVAHEKAEMYAYSPKHTVLPALGFQYRGEEVINMMPPNQDAVTFVNNHLSRVVKTLRRIQTNEGSVVIEDEYEGEFDIAAHEEMEGRMVEDSPVAVAAQVFARTKIQRKYLPALNDSTFYSVTAESELVLVLFYLTFEPRSMVTLQHFVNASVILANSTYAGSELRPFATVDCFDWTDVCGRENVTTWPSVRAYRKGKPVLTYSGLLSPQALANYVNILRAGSPIELRSAAEFDTISAGMLLDGSRMPTEVHFVAFFDQKSSPEFEMFMDTSSKWEGKHLFAYVTGELSKTILKSLDEKNVETPSLYAWHRGDKISPSTRFADEWTTDKLHHFIQTLQLPTFPELRVDTLPVLLAKKLPLVILFTDTTDTDAYAAMTELVRANSFPDHVLCWMNIAEGVSQRLLLEYSPAAVPPAVTIVNHATATVHNYNGVAMTSDALSSWMQAVHDKQLQPSKLLKETEWKPRFSDFNFLKKIEDAKRKKLESGEDNFEEEEEKDTSGLEVEEAATRARLVQGIHGMRHHHGGKQAKSNHHMTHTEL